MELENSYYVSRFYFLFGVLTDGAVRCDVEEKYRPYPLRGIPSDLSERDATIVQLAISRNTIKASDVAELYGASIQSASQSLRNLKLKGYLQAVEAPDPTGGYYLEYSPVDCLKRIT